MTIEEIEKKVKHIEEVQGDCEMARGAEDALREIFIEWLSYRNDDIGEMATKIMSTNKLTFKRWYA